MFSSLFDKAVFDIDIFCTTVTLVICAIRN